MSTMKRKKFQISEQNVISSQKPIIEIYQKEGEKLNRQISCCDLKILPLKLKVSLCES